MQPAPQSSQFECISTHYPGGAESFESRVNTIQRHKL